MSLIITSISDDFKFKSIVINVLVFLEHSTVVRLYFITVLLHRIMIIFNYTDVYKKSKTMQAWTHIFIVDIY